MSSTDNRAPLVLVADDDEDMRSLLQTQLNLDGYRVVAVDSGLKAIAEARAQEIDVALLDAIMPGTDGFAVAKLLKESELTRAVPVIMITALGDHESRLRALKAGVQEFLTKPVDRAELSLRVRNILKLKQYNNFLADQNRALEEMVRERSREVLSSYRETITALCRAAAYKDEETGGHVNRISLYTEQLATVLGMNADFCETIHYASQMHDIGKIAIPEAILLKQGVLRRDEWEIMKTHCRLGAGLIGDGQSPYLRMGAEIALHHHERWDGGGYPMGLKGELIPISARIMNVCDQYDALRSERPHKRPLSHDRAVEIITRGDGRTMPSHFDPEVLAAFRHSIDTFSEIFDTVTDADGPGTGTGGYSGD